MKIYINEITGLGQAFESLLMSKRSWTREKAIELYELVYFSTFRDGMLIESGQIQFRSWMDKIIKYGVEYGHTTLLRFIDISITVEGLHRYGQDDLDSHAARMDNRIVRASTRLGKFSDGEKSDYYKDKIMYPFEVLKGLGIEIPKSYIGEDGNTYVITDFGYVREDLKDVQDAKRGLYPGAIPSTFTFKVQYPEFCHIYQHRNENSNANPEVKQCVEMIADELRNWNIWLYENLNKLVMEPGER